VVDIAGVTQSRNIAETHMLRACCLHIVCIHPKHLHVSARKHKTIHNYRTQKNTI